jgi:hypothetical protein
VDDQAIAVRFPGGPGSFCSQTQPDRFRDPVGFLSGPSPPPYPAEYICNVVNLTARSHSVKRIRITGILSLLPSYALLECTVTTWPFNSNEQDRQCTYTVILRRVREWKSNNYYIFCLLPWDIQHAMRMRHFVICCLPRSTISSHFSSWTAPFSKKNLIDHKMCFYFLYNFCLKHF